MITLRRLDLIRKESPATADELASLQTQLNGYFDQIQKALDKARVVRTEAPSQTVGDAGTAEVLPARPSGYVEIEIDGKRYEMPFYAKG